MTRSLDHKLMTETLRLEYDAKTYIGCLYQAACSYCDMTATIEVFEQIDPDVRLIKTFDAGKLDTCYVKQADGLWQARIPR
jgi:hypothetical protein